MGNRIGIGLLFLIAGLLGVGIGVGVLMAQSAELPTELELNTPMKSPVPVVSNPMAKAVLEPILLPPQRINPMEPTPIPKIELTDPHMNPPPERVPVRESVERSSYNTEPRSSYKADRANSDRGNTDRGNLDRSESDRGNLPRETGKHESGLPEPATPRLLPQNLEQVPGGIVVVPYWNPEPTTAGPAHPSDTTHQATKPVITTEKTTLESKAEEPIVGTFAWQTWLLPVVAVLGTLSIFLLVFYLVCWSIFHHWGSALKHEIAATLVKPMHAHATIPESHGTPMNPLPARSIVSHAEVVLLNDTDTPSARFDLGPLPMTEEQKQQEAEYLYHVVQENRKQWINNPEGSTTEEK